MMKIVTRGRSDKGAGWEAMAWVAVGYGLVGMAMLSVIHPWQDVAMIWPSSGIAAAGLFRFGARAWPGVFAGSLAVGVFRSLSFMAAAGVAVGNTLEALLAAAALRRLAGGARFPAGGRHVLVFALIGGFLAPMVGATVGVTAMRLAGLVAGAAGMTAWISRWLGHGIGVLLVAPLILVWTGGRRPFWDRRKTLIAAGLLASLVFGGVAAFDNLLPANLTHYAVAFVCLPALVSAAFHLGIRVCATGMAVFAVAAYAAALRGRGPFTGMPEDEASLLIIAYLGIIQILLLALAADAERARRLEAVEASDEGVVEADANGIVTGWNRGAERIFGWPAAEMVGQPVKRLFPDDAVEETSAAIAAVRAGRVVEDFETVRLRKDGSRVFVSLSLSPVREAGGRIRGTLAVILDVTRRKREGEALARLAAIVQSSDDAILGLDLDGRVTSWNLAAERLLGFAASEAVGRFYSDLVAPAHPDHRAEVAGVLSRLRGGASVAPYEIEREGKAGQPLYLSVSASAVRDGRGRLVGAAMILRDITGRKLYEEALSKLASLGEGNPVPVIELDMDLRVTFLNGPAERAFPDLPVLRTRHPVLSGLRAAVADMRKTAQRRFVSHMECRGEWYERHLVIPHPGLIRLYVLSMPCRPGVLPPCVMPGAAPAAGVRGSA